MTVEEVRGRRALLAGSALILAFWLVAKVQLFRNLEYFGGDFVSFLQMSRSFRYTGRLLWENVYGNHAAIHNFYTMPLYFPLTYLIGGYGLILGMWAAYVLGAVITVRTAVLTLNGKIAVLAVLLSPIGFWVFDDAQWGFHPEISYAPLGLLLILWLLEGRHLAAALTALVMAATKEDGPVVVAAVLLPFFLARLWERREDSVGRRRVLRSAAMSLATCALVFAVGMAYLLAKQGGASDHEDAAAPRIWQSIIVLGSLLLGRGDSSWGSLILFHLGGFLFIGLCGAILAPHRLAAAASIAIAGGLLAPVLFISAGFHGFGLLFWSPRVATFLAAVLAGVSVSAALPGPAATVAAGDGSARPLPLQLLLVAAVWAVQAAFLAWYPINTRPDLAARLNRATSHLGQLRSPEADFVACLADRLPRDFPVESIGLHTPLFHRQAVVFPERRKFAWTPARLRVALPGDGAAPDFIGRVGRVVVTGAPEMSSLVSACTQPDTSRISGTAPR